MLFHRDCICDTFIVKSIHLFQHQFEVSDFFIRVKFKQGIQKVVYFMSGFLQWIWGELLQIITFQIVDFFTNRKIQTSSSSTLNVIFNLTVCV